VRNCAPVSEKGRYHDAAQWRLYPIGRFNSWCARPFSSLLAGLRFSPNQVSVLSLLVSIAGMILVASATWESLVIGALMVHLGLLLDHADGQVARKRGMGSTWGMYLDMAFDRIVEVGIIAAMVPVMLSDVLAPTWLPASWQPLGAIDAAILATVTIGIMMTWRFLTAYNDVLYMRAHLVETGRLPTPGVTAQGLAKRPLLPIVFNRDWVLLIWLVGVLANQAQATMMLLLALHVLVLLEKMIVFYVRHKRPEGDANRILGRDYH
jgi:phosphatidylglycerophosphate synthase